MHRYRMLQDCKSIQNRSIIVFVHKMLLDEIWQSRLSHESVEHDEFESALHAVSGIVVKS